MQRLASQVSGLLGRNSSLVRAMRPLYQWALDRSTGGRGFVRTVNGHERFNINPRHLGLFPEVYEPTVCEYLRERVTSGDHCLNVGAHVGLFTLCLAEWSKPNGHVWAFEPNPATRGILNDHVRRNGCEARVTILEQAIADSRGRASFLADKFEGTSRLGSPNPARGGPHDRIEVPVNTIDAFCQQYDVRPDWIVMDVEGYEVAALAGARATIHAAAGGLGLVVELHPHLWESAGSSRAALEALLAELRVMPLALQGQHDPLAEPGVVALVRLAAA